MTNTFQAHSSAPNFVFECGINGCIQTFRTLSAMSSHLRRRHYDFDSESVCSSAGHSLPYESMETDPDQSASVCDEADGGTDEDDSGLLMVPEPPQHLVMQKACASLLLTLKEKHKLTQRALDFSIGQISEVINCVASDIKKRVDTAALELSESTGINPPDFSHCFQAFDPFEGLHSEYMQEKFYKEHFNLLVSIIHAAAGTHITLYIILLSRTAVAPSKN